MNRLIFAAGFSVALLWTFVDSSLAATVTFTGVIDEVSGNPAGVVTGDTFTGIFFFHPNPADTFGHFGGLVDRYSIAIGDLMVSGTTEPFQFANGVVFNTDPSQGGVSYQAFVNDFDPLSGKYTSLGIDVTLQAGTPGGVIPPLDRFNLNDFFIGLQLANNPDHSDRVSGHITSFPTFDLNQVSDGGPSLALLGCGLVGLVVLRWGLRAPSAMAARLEWASRPRIGEAI
jgi:hypothetical protein